MKAKTVCIIDDDPIFVFGTKILLNHKNNFADDIIIYENGKEALDSLSAMIKKKEDLPEIIFLDLNMPVMNGWHFLEAFVKIPMVHLPLVFITTSSIDQEDRIKAQQYQIVKEFLAKPLSESLLEKVFVKHNYF